MLKFTIKEALEGQHNTLGYYLYLYSDKEVMFYVGKSVHPLGRLKDHLGIGRYGLGSRLGTVIQDNHPESLTWSLTLFALDECLSLVEKHRDVFYRHYCTTLEKMKPYGPVYEDGMVSIAESALIEEYQPCLNIADVGYVNNIPERYIKHVRPGTSSGMYLDL